MKVVTFSAAISQWLGRWNVMGSFTIPPRVILAVCVAKHWRKVCVYVVFWDLNIFSVCVHTAIKNSAASHLSHWWTAPLDEPIPIVCSPPDMFESRRKSIIIMSKHKNTPVSVIFNVNLLVNLMKARKRRKGDIKNESLEHLNKWCTEMWAELLKEQSLITSWAENLFFASPHFV